MIKVGDKVKIIDTGKLYSAYEDWAIKHKLTNWIRFTPKEGTIGTVVAKGNHEDTLQTLLGVEIDNHYSIIIDKLGVVKVGDIFTTGDEVEVSDNTEKYIKAVFIGEYEGVYYTRMCNLSGNLLYPNVSPWRYCRFPLKTKKVTIDLPDGYEIKLQKINEAKQ